MPQVKDILDYFRKQGHDVKGGSNSTVEISGGRNVSQAGVGEITFLGPKLAEQASRLFSESKASVIVVDKKIFESLKDGVEDKVVVVADDAKGAMVSCLKHFFPLTKSPSIHPSASIHSSAKIGTNNYIAAFVVIDENVEIGDDCIIEPFVHLKANTLVRNCVKIKSGTVIGGSGFGYVQQPDKHWENFPHFGKVIIEDDVHIGSNTCIDRGALGDTILKRGVKVDNLVHIAHNVVIGENSLIIADAMIGGSAEIGSNVWVAPSSSIRNGIQIGANSVIGMGAVVTKSVRKELPWLEIPQHYLRKRSEHCWQQAIPGRSPIIVCTVNPSLYFAFATI
jgi:UDP-3-O-[3-hydroxymyristoyl] glucosamine N-acyltransferase